LSWHFPTELARFGQAFTQAGRAPNLAFSREYCRRVTTRHYENFSVASLLLPRRLLVHFHAVYAYCRWADDLADESGGGDTALSLLNCWRGELMQCYGGRPVHPVLVALQSTIRKFDIPPEPFLNLLLAFEQDQRVTDYATFADVLAYCVNSANPVGRLVLYLFGQVSDTALSLSDDICTGLQLANFWQDVARDAAIGRCYIPQEDLARFSDFRDCLRFQVERTWGYFHRGRGLLPMLTPEARRNIRLFVEGGEATLRAIEQVGYDTRTMRPTVGTWTKIKLVLGVTSSIAIQKRGQSPFLLGVFK
jgi:squalene synthase HpnC